MKNRHPMKPWLYPFICMVLTFICSCSDKKNSTPNEKARLSREAKKATEIYDILKDYPGLENFFTYGNLEIAEFERKLFGDFIGNDNIADILVSGIDVFPNFVNKGTETPAGIFSNETSIEMASKGPLPDLFSAFGIITESIMAVSEEKKEPFYNYLDELDKLKRKTADGKGPVDYMLEIVAEIFRYLSTQEDDDITLFMNNVVKDFMEFRVTEDGNLDFNDWDELFEKFTKMAPEGSVELLEGFRMAFYDQEVRDVIEEGLRRLGNFLGDERAFPELKALMENLYKKYDAESFGDLIKRFWDDGPVVNSEVVKMGIEDYGKGGKQDGVFHELLMHPNLVRNLFVTFYNFRKAGFGFDGIDDAVARMVRNNPLLSELKGDGDFGNGQFHEPNEHFSYQHFSALKGAVALLNRWNVPATLTCPVFWERDQTPYERKATEELMKVIRYHIPNADTFSLMPALWTTVYEKDSDSYIGNGTPVTEKREGSGIMVDGVFVAPVCADMVTLEDLAGYLFADSVINGPYDNIYDNMNWLIYERPIYLVIDLMWLLPEIPSLNYWVVPALKRLGYKELTVKLIEMKGAQGFLNLELSVAGQNILKELSRGLIQWKIPEFLARPITEVIGRLIPFADHHKGEGHIFLMPEDIRDLATLVWSVTYYDPAAFNVEKFLDEENPENHMNYYDVSGYSYPKDKDRANQVWNVGAAFSVAAYLAYENVVKDYPKNLANDGIEARQNAAREEFGLIFPYQYFNNVVSALSEVTTGVSIYTKSDGDYMPFFEYLSPLLEMESCGFIDKCLELVAVLGKPELETAREKFTNGLAKIVSTIDKDSRSPNTFASELHHFVGKAVDDEKRWHAINLLTDGYHEVLKSESEYEVLDSLVGLVDLLTGVDMTEEEFRLAAEGIVEVVGSCAEKKSFTRRFFHLTTIFDELDQLDTWPDTVELLNEALKEGGIYNYVIRGLTKDPDIPWSQVIEDTDRFLHSELVTSYEEGSFFKDVYYLLEYLVNVLEEE